MAAYSDARLAVWRIGAPAQVDSVLRFNHSRKHYEAWKGSSGKLNDILNGLYALNNYVKFYK